MTNPVIEAMARAIEAKYWGDNPDTPLDPNSWVRWCPEARAAIQALKDNVSPAMLIGAGTIHGFSEEVEDADRHHVEWFQAMLDTALKEETDGSV